jgi:hypothetical protein
MKSRYVCVALLLLTGLIRVGAAEPIQDDYLRMYVWTHDGDMLAKNKDYFGAIVHYKTALAWFQQSAKWDPSWETALLRKKIDELQRKIADLRPLAIEQNKREHDKPDNSGPTPYVWFHDGIQSEKAHDYWAALDSFEKYSTTLEIIQGVDPNWERTLIEERLKESQMHIDQIATLIVQEQLRKAGWNPVQ